MAFTHTELVSVHAWGMRVGAVAASNQRGTYAFEYDPAWLRRDVELAPILMPTSRRSRIFTFPGLNPQTFYGLPPMLADALPDRFGNALIDARLAREGISHSDITPLDRLAYVGSRTMGALTFVPDNGPEESPVGSIELAHLVEAARAAVEGNLDDPRLRTGTLAQLLAVGTSAGGARAKAVIAVNADTGELRVGDLATADGSGGDRFEDWLLKFDGVGLDAQLGESQQYGRIEYAYYLMARACGIAMAPSRLLEEGGRAHFMTRRFDRGTQGERIHLQSLCAVAGLDFNETGTHDYAEYLAVLDQLGIDDREQAFRRIVFNVLASNNDDHTKNLSFLMDRDGTWRLAPAYDLTFAYNPANRWLARHLMSVSGRFEDIARADLERLGDRFEVRGIRAILTEVAEAVARWPEHAAEAGVAAGVVAEVSERLSAVALS